MCIGEMNPLKKVPPVMYYTHTIENSMVYLYLYFVVEFLYRIALMI